MHAKMETAGFRREEEEQKREHVMKSNVVYMDVESPTSIGKHLSTECDTFLANNNPSELRRAKWW